MKITPLKGSILGGIQQASPKVDVSQACRVLEVSRSSYYAYQAERIAHLAGPRVCAQSVHFKAAFAAGHKAYGTTAATAASPRLHQPKNS